MDLDDDELRATRILNGVDKTADKMFEKLGYRKNLDNEYEVEYYIWDIYITFDKEEKTIQKRVEFENIYLAMSITIEELKAINKKCEELGWKEYINDKNKFRKSNDGIINNSYVFNI